MKSYVSRAALAAVIAVGIAAPAGAATVVHVAATPVYSGPTPTFDFEIAQPAFYESANLVNLPPPSGTHARPIGSTGQFFSAGPAAGTPGEIFLSSFNSISSISFLWGSVDLYNDLELVDGIGNVFQTINGAAVLGPGAIAGNQFLPGSNRFVTINFTGAERQQIAGLRLNSSLNAFEIDTMTIGTVPEPATWAMMIGGFGLVGFALRSRRRSSRAAIA